MQSLLNIRAASLPIGREYSNVESNAQKGLIAVPGLP